ncbi:MAG: 8-oxo-dGTP diphosphatase MutT, partial [Eubacteriales bacterium]
MRKLKDVAAGIITQNNKVLITRRAPNENLPSKWEFPGGKVEAGETPEDCLARELKEELNIIVKVKDFFCESIYSYPADKIKLLAYNADWIDGKITLTVHDDYKFVELEELLQYDLAPADIPIAK